MLLVLLPFNNKIDSEPLESLGHDENTQEITVENADVTICQDELPIPVFDTIFVQDFERDELNSTKDLGYYNGQKLVHHS